MKLNAIKPNPKNPRLIKDERFEKLVKSIEDFPKMMSLRPIIVDNDGMILGGNMRFKALVHLGFKEIPDTWVKRADELTEEEKVRFQIADNVQFGDWDWETLKEWEGLEDWGLEEGVNMSDFERPEFTGEKPCEKDEKYFYIEYYGDGKLYEELKKKIGENIEGTNRINAEYFKTLILG